MTTLSGMWGVCPLSNYPLPAHPGWRFVRLLKWHIPITHVTVLEPFYKCAFGV
jgi:hypothetical protein